MKFLIVALMVAFATVSNFGQSLDEQLNVERRYTGKGRCLYGASVSLLWPHGQLSTFQFGFQPEFGFFPFRNFAVMGKIHTSFGASTLTDKFVFNIGAGPELRYYIGKASFKFYLYGNAIPHYTYFNQPGFGIITGGGPGFSFFTGPRFSFNLALYGGVYRTTLIDATQPILALSFVFNGFFSKKKQNDKELLIEEK